MAVRAIDQVKASALGTSYAVSSSHPAVTQVGGQVLATGGNAFDATLAMAAVAWVVLPGQCGPGGDAFALTREPDGRVRAVSGSGFGPDGGTPGFYRDRRLEALPLDGPLSVAVPGALAAIGTLQARATRSLAELWSPAIELAGRGVPCTAKTLADVAEHRGSLEADPGLRSVFLPGGRLPRIGEVLRQPDLAATLRRLAADPAAFHTGWFADRAITFLRGTGAPFSGDEWTLGAAAPAEDAISAVYSGRTLHQTPTPSAGWMVLHQAALCDGVLGATDQLGPEAVHWFAEAARTAFRHRFASCGADNEAWRDALDQDAIRRSRAAISAHVAGAAPAVAPVGDTTSTVCVDADGTAVSFIHSLAFTFGSRTTVPGTGVVLNNRLGRGAYLVAGHPNEVAPRRKPLHTLNAWLLEEDGDLLATGNCPGGDGQVQWNMQVISHLLDHGDDPQRAVSLPRVTVFPGSDADVLDRPQVLRCEEGLPAGTLSTLAGWGHVVEETPVQRGGPGGSALVVKVDRGRGVLHAAADPRMEGVAVAL